MFVVVELLARGGADLTVTHLTNGEGDIVTLLRVVDEDPPAVRDGDARCIASWNKCTTSSEPIAASLASS